MARPTAVTSQFDHQIYRQADDGYGRPRYYYAADLVRWASKNAELCAIKLDVERALHMLEEGMVNPQHVASSLKNPNTNPIVLCLRAVGGSGDQIVDGNHRYVAACYRYEITREEKLIPAYLVEPKHWTRFVVPDDLVPSLGLRDP